ncbi:MAG TPA: aspartyl/asparaginyl beta-hydroxylase domain-containing protein [Balneolaceae bacterium]|nr:aspartyl/asparaginyl beta-hydroxylase domain-containing protein [Balneolaceae bacterium]
MGKLSQRIKEKKRKAVKDLGGTILWNLEKLVERNSKVPTKPILDTADFDWVALLEANWQSIRRELDKLLIYKEAMPNFQDISRDQKSISEDDNWKTYFFFGFGYKAEANCARCPITTKLLEQIPDLTTAFFSILNPGKHIPEHRGVFKGILRYHLGLKVPEPAEDCVMRVEGINTHWQEGQSILFDDTYRHEVWNKTSGVRVVLLIDVLRPLRFPVNVLNKTLISLIKRSDYVQDARKNQEAWEQKFGKQVDQKTTL